MVYAGFSLRIYAQPKGCGYNMLRHEFVKLQLSDSPSRGGIRDNLVSVNREFQAKERD